MANDNNIPTQDELSAFLEKTIRDQFTHGFKEAALAADPDDPIYKDYRSATSLTGMNRNVIHEEKKPAINYIIQHAAEKSPYHSEFNDLLRNYKPKDKLYKQAIILFSHYTMDAQHSRLSRLSRIIKIPNIIADKIRGARHRQNDAEKLVKQLKGLPENENDRSNEKVIALVLQAATAAAKVTGEKTNFKGRFQSMALHILAKTDDDTLHNAAKLGQPHHKTPVFTRK